MGPSKYDLLANICHDSQMLIQTVTVGGGSSASTPYLQDMKSAKKVASSFNIDPSAAAAGKASNFNSSVLTNGLYKIHLNHPTSGNGIADQLFEIQDLHVNEIQPQLVGLSEAYVLFYSRKKV